MTGIEAFVMVDTLIAYANKVRKLNLSTLTELKLLGCGSNPIDSLDLSNNPSLLELYADGCNLTYVDPSNNPLLEIFSCERKPPPGRSVILQEGPIFPSYPIRQPYYNKEGCQVLTDSAVLTLPLPAPGWFCKQANWDCRFADPA